MAKLRTRACLRPQARHGRAHHRLDALKLYDDLSEKQAERFIVVLGLSSRRLPKPTSLFGDLRLRLLDHDGRSARGFRPASSSRYRASPKPLSFGIRQIEFSDTFACIVERDSHFRSFTIRDFLSRLVRDENCLARHLQPPSRRTLEMYVKKRDKRKRPRHRAGVFESKIRARPRVSPEARAANKSRGAEVGEDADDGDSSPEEQPRSDERETHAH